MSALLSHWSADPFGILALAVAGWHEAGLARLRRRQPEQARARRRRSLVFYAGLAVTLAAVQSPVEFYAQQYFWVHMIQHLLLMFAAPTLIVAGAPWSPLRAAWPGSRRRPRAAAAAAARDRSRWPGPVRAAGRLARSPWTAIVAFNLVMIFWHLPGPLDASVTSAPVRTWLMHGSFLVAGVAFWLQFLRSPPARMRLTPLAQAAALLGTNVVMWILAMAMGILTSSSWYSVYDHVPGVTLPAFADQQIGAGILWVCGDFWAIPCLIVIVRRVIAEDGSVGAAMDRMLGRGARRYQWANRA